MKLLVSILLFFISLSSYGQFTCGTAHDSDPNFSEAAFQAFKQKQYKRSNAQDSVAITFHVVDNSIDIETVLEEIDFINRYFSATGLHFFACGSPRSINGNDRYTFAQGNELNRSNYKLNTINVYYVRQVVDNAGNDLCGYANFPWRGQPADRYIVVSTLGGCLVRGTTLAHELGHFYGLLHTHETAQGRELVDGSNCRRAGDGLCDTPADPNMGRAGVMRGCTYIGNEADANGQAYNPDPGNMMSYAPPSCSSRFSVDQHDRMRFYHETDNTYLRDECNFFPDFEVSSDEGFRSIRSDENLQLAYSFQNLGIQEDYEVPVFIYLSDDEEERGQIIKRDTITLLANQGVITENFEIDFPINRSTGTYYLTILVDPEFKVLELQEANNLFTIQLEVDNSGLDDEVLFPNPVSTELKLFLRDPKLAQAFIISIYDVSGRLHKQTNAFKNRDEYFTLLDVSDLNDGLYIIDLYFEAQNKRKSYKFYKTNIE